MSADLSPRAALARALGRPASPTVDLYLLNALGTRAAALRRTAPTVFETDEAVLVIRHDARARVGREERRRIVYLLDDAVFAALGDGSLPLWWRAKLATVEVEAARRLLPRAAALVVSADEIAETLPPDLRDPSRETARIDPYWSEPFPDLDHFDDGAPPMIAFTGAQTHAGELRFVTPAVAEVLAARPSARFVHSAGHRTPGALRGRAQVAAVAQTRWPDYRAALGTMRRRVALYPLPDTAVARARSVNKLIEHALMGAAPIYAEGWPRARLAAEAGAGLTAPRRAAAWRDAMLLLLDDPETGRATAAAAQALARRLNRPEPQRALWARLLGLPALARDEESGE